MHAYEPSMEHSNYHVLGGCAHKSGCYANVRLINLIKSNNLHGTHTQL